MLSCLNFRQNRFFLSFICSFLFLLVFEQLSGLIQNIKYFALLIFNVGPVLCLVQVDMHRKLCDSDLDIVFLTKVIDILLHCYHFLLVVLELFLKFLPLTTTAFTDPAFHVSKLLLYYLLKLHLFQVFSKLILVLLL